MPQHIVRPAAWIPKEMVLRESFTILLQDWLKDNRLTPSSWILVRRSMVCTNALLVLRHSAIQGNVLQWIQSCWTEANKFSSKASHPQPLLLSLVSLKEPSSALCPSFFTPMTCRVKSTSCLAWSKSLIPQDINHFKYLSSTEKSREAPAMVDVIQSK